MVHQMKLNKTYAPFSLTNYTLLTIEYFIQFLSKSKFYDGFTLTYRLATELVHVGH